MSGPYSYLEHLPAIYSEDADWLARYLRGFQAILTGVGDPRAPGLEERLDGITSGDERTLRGIERLFDPGPGRHDGERAPAEFLEWLSDWVALTLRADVGEEVHRELIANAIGLYRLRGTKAGLARVLDLYGIPATIVDSHPDLQVGVTCTVGVDTWAGGAPPHHFRVTVSFPTTDPQEIAARRRLVEEIIDAERPVHTSYTLDIETAAFQLGPHSRVGLDTVLGTDPPNG